MKVSEYINVRQGCAILPWRFRLLSYTRGNKRESRLYLNGNNGECE